MHYDKINSGEHVMNEDYIITGFFTALRVHDEGGKTIFIKNRRSASFIYPLSGEIEFTDGHGSVTADENSPVYIPCGASYKNRCIRDADSILFNIYDTNGYENITSIPQTSHGDILSCFEAVSSCGSADGFYVLSQIYKLLHAEFETENKNINPALYGAIQYINRNYGKAGLSLSDISSAVHISTVYLNKLFTAGMNTTPFKYLTKIRMEKAAAYLCEARSISEIAENVGYGDIYRFSRAFKKHYGVSPKKFLIKGE